MADLQIVGQQLAKLLKKQNAVYIEAPPFFSLLLSVFKPWG